MLTLINASPAYCCGLWSFKCYFPFNHYTKNPQTWLRTILTQEMQRVDIIIVIIITIIIISSAIFIFGQGVGKTNICLLVIDFSATATQTLNRHHHRCHRQHCRLPILEITVRRASLSTTNPLWLKTGENILLLAFTTPPPSILADFKHKSCSFSFDCLLFCHHEQIRCAELHCDDCQLNFAPAHHITSQHKGSISYCPGSFSTFEHQG